MNIFGRSFIGTPLLPAAIFVDIFLALTQLRHERQYPPWNGLLISMPQHDLRYRSVFNAITHGLFTENVSMK